MQIPLIINAVIGLILIYFSFSLLLSAIQEYISNLLEWRASHLRESIRQMLDSGNSGIQVTQRLYENSLIQSLNQKGKRAFWRKESIGPSYIDSDIFAIGLLQVLRQYYGLNFDQENNSLEAILAQFKLSQNKSTLAKLPEPLFQTLKLLAEKAIAQQVNQTATTVDWQQEIADWFDRSMRRASGVYKRNSAGFALVCGLIISATVNVNSVAIFKRLYADPVLNQQISNIAIMQVQTCQEKVQDDAFSCLRAANQQLNLAQFSTLPLGWKKEVWLERNLIAWFTTFLGWGISGIAIAQGAPFWFDLLNNVVNIRNTGEKVDSSEEKHP